MEHWSGFAVSVLKATSQKLPSPERGGDGACQCSTENDSLDFPPKRTLRKFSLSPSHEISASLKRSLNLSANKYYYYYGERLDCLKAVLVLNVAQQKSPSPERGGDGASQFSTENDLPRLSGY